MRRYGHSISVSREDKYCSRLRSDAVWSGRWYNFFGANFCLNFSKIGERFAFFTRPELRLRHAAFKFMSL